MKPYRTTPTAGRLHDSRDSSAHQRQTLHPETHSAYYLYVAQERSVPVGCLSRQMHVSGACTTAGSTHANRTVQCSDHRFRLRAVEVDLAP